MKIQIFTKKDFNNYIKKSEIYYNNYQTPAGKLFILSTNDGIFSSTFSNEVQNNYNMKKIDFSNLLLSGTEFQIKVWKQTLEIPKGKTKNYESIANAINCKQSFRAVANALAQNKIAYFIPCHRVICKNGKISGYKWGIDKKIKLLESEKDNLNFF